MNEKNTAVVLADEISRSLNSYGFDSKAFAESMLHEHRTIQQCFMRNIVLPYLKALSNVPSYDDRNEASVLLARAILERTTEEERCLPFI